ncbi:FxsA family protein [Corynebacterium sp. TAE3-ERU12]|uniref:FxsA family protein n=1 Tax=Corynebacterium sp. TAE3-ERU12 TaxID=2849491 RepID=UPI001C48D9D4|nr:FxsA family protein [Corynebacterium sp. TAE3-ERU12]MBV7295485.1 FxsA family protein [Corynebacterium sp. TAE3-ERU12]
MKRVLFALYIIAELVAIWALAQWIGWLWTVLVIMALFFFGMIFAAVQMRKVAEASLTGQRPGRVVADSAMVFVGSIFVALPGLVNTICGLLMIAPPTRTMLRRIISRATMAWIENTATSSMTIVRTNMKSKGYDPDAGQGLFGTPNQGTTGHTGTDQTIIDMPDDVDDNRDHRDGRA